jgi:hypothetical protein
MADIKVSGLAAVAAFLGTHEYPVNEAGTSKKITGTQLIAAVAQGTLSGGYVQVTANQTPNTVNVDVTGLTVTVTPGVSRRIKLTFFCGATGSSVTTDTLQIYIQEGATVLQQINSPALTVNPAVTGSVVLTPTNAAHTYKATCTRTGTGNVTLFASATQPMFLLAEDIGV